MPKTTEADPKPIVAETGDRPDDADPGEQVDAQGLDPIASPKTDRGEVIGSPAWQHPDYSGPLTGDQALWRQAHLRTK